MTELVSSTQVWGVLALLGLLASLGLGWRLRQALQRLQALQSLQASCADIEAQLESGERLRNIFLSSPDAIGVARVRDGRYIAVNPSYTRTIGYEPEVVLQNSPTSLGVWAKPEQRTQMHEELARSGLVDSMEVDMRRKDGRIVRGLLSIRMLVEKGEDCHLFIFRDITERLRLQAEAEAARSQVAAAAAANQAKTEFLSRMSHELRTPMNAVLGFAQLLRGTPALAGPAHSVERERVESILHAGWHLLTLIDDVLDIARIETGHMALTLKTLSLAQVIKQAAELVHPLALEQAINVDLGAPAGSPWQVLGDEQRLRQVLVNLLSNAIKYNHRGGRVSLSGEVEGGRCTLHISDTGVGMSEEQLAHLFEPFNRLGRECEGIEGTGIGLVLTRQLLELMDGALVLRSRPGEGTTVSLQLPLAAQACGPDLVPAAIAAASPKACVLYIEDNPVNQLIVQQALQCWEGLELHLADDGEQGLRRAVELCPDLILLDMRLPDTTGLALLPRLRAEAALSATRVVALSASAMPEEVSQAKAEGALEYWTKPLKLDCFLSDMRRVLEQAARQPA